MSGRGLLHDLIKQLCCLPGVGPKSAQRMAFQLLQNDRTGMEQLAEILKLSAQNIGQCGYCRTLTEQELCEICSNPSRDATLVCIVESPSDVWVVDQATQFNGKFFVLHGRLSPIDGIGPEQIGIQLLEEHLSGTSLNEIILATNSTVEGEATAHFIADLAAKYQVKASRIAHGVPMGGELEYIDRGTISHAFNGRQLID